MNSLRVLILDLKVLGAFMAWQGEGKPSAEYAAAYLSVKALELYETYRCDNERAHVVRSLAVHY